MNDDIQQMGTLLQRMTTESSGEIKFTENQVTAVMEILLPRIATDLPGLPAGFTCSVDRDDAGWTLRILRPVNSAVEPPVVLAQQMHNAENQGPFKLT